MKIFQDIANVWRVLRGGSSWAQAFLAGEEANLNRTSGAQLGKEYQQSVWIYCALNALSQKVSEIEFVFCTESAGTEKRIEAGPVVDLFARPHPQMDRFLFWEMIVTYLGLSGEAFILALDKQGGVLPISRGGRQKLKIDRLLVLNPQQFWHYIEAQELIGWRYYGSGREQPLMGMSLLPEEVLQIKLPNPYSFWRGMPPLQVAMVAAQTDYASAQFMKGLMLNNADTGVIITTDQQPSAEQREQIVASLKERKRAAGTADRPLFLWGGAKVEKPTISSADLQFIENRNLNRKEIGAIYGVPPTLMGFTEDANRAVAKEEHLNFVQNRIAPLVKRIQAGVQPIIAALDPTVEGFFDIEALPIMQQARTERAATATAYFNMGVPFNDINQVLDLGFQDLPWGATGFLPFNLQPAGQVQAAAPGAEETGTAAAADPVARILRALKAPPDSGVGIQDEKKGAREFYRAALQASIKSKQSKLSRFFFEQRARVLAGLEKANAERGTPNAELRSFDEPFNLDDENAKLKARLKPTLLADLEAGGAALWKEIGLEGFKLKPEAAIRFLAAREQKITGINETTFEKLKETLADGLDSGDTMKQLADRVKAVYGEATDWRAEMIAVTETNTAQNAGRYMGMDDAGIQLKGWLTANDERVRDSHAQAEAESADGIPLEETFSNGLMSPCDPDGPPDEVINCRCTLIAVLPPGLRSWPPLRLCASAVPNPAAEALLGDLRAFAAATPSSPGNGQKTELQAVPGGLQGTQKGVPNV